MLKGIFIWFFACKEVINQKLHLLLGQPLASWDCRSGSKCNRYFLPGFKFQGFIQIAILVEHIPQNLSFISNINIGRHSIDYSRISTQQVYTEAHALNDWQQLFQKRKLGSTQFNCAGKKKLLSERQGLFGGTQCIFVNYSFMSRVLVNYC